MSKQILIIKGSPRKSGNTSAMADAFARGASETKNLITEVILKDKTIGDCMGCGVCQRNGGVCVQKDDMPEIYDAMKKTDVIVLAYLEQSSSFKQTRGHSHDCGIKYD